MKLCRKNPQDVPASTSQTIVSPMCRKSIRLSRFLVPDDIKGMASGYLMTFTLMNRGVFVKDFFVRIFLLMYEAYQH
jgi:hypothetical protein